MGNVKLYMDIHIQRDRLEVTIQGSPGKESMILDYGIIKAS